MPDAPALFREEKGGAGAHGGDDGLVLPAHGQGAGAAGGKLVHHAGGQAVDLPLHVGGPHAGEDHPLHIRQGEPVSGEIASESAVETGQWISRLNPEGGEEGSSIVKAHDFRRGTADVDAEDGFHKRVLPC